MLPQNANTEQTKDNKLLSTWSRSLTSSSNEHLDSSFVDCCSARNNIHRSITSVQLRHINISCITHVTKLYILAARKMLQ